MSSSPVIDPRDARAVLADIYRRLPGYTPEWQPQPGGTSSPVAAGLFNVYARYLEIIIHGLNQLPDQRMIAFLDMLGDRLLPAQSARAPLVFTLIENSPIDVSLPANSQVAASIQPSSAPLSGAGSSQTQQPILFSTDQSLILTRAKLASVYSLQPGSDQIAGHTPYLSSGFTPFQEAELVDHAIYLGHDLLFAYTGKIAVILNFDLTEFADQSLKIQWEYLSQCGWIPFSNMDEDDSTNGLRKNGQLILRRSSGPDAAKGTFLGHTSYWLRGRLAAALLPADHGGPQTLPSITTIRARVQFHKEDVRADAAFNDEGSVDTTKDFYPFSQQPGRSSTFSVACREAFQRKTALVHLNFTLSQAGRVNGDVQLTWEYYDGRSWMGLGVDPSINNLPSYKFTNSGSVSFRCPGDWAETAVNGAKNYWLRARIIQGDYGYPLRLNLAPARKILDVQADGKTLEVDTNQGYSGGESVDINGYDGTKTAGNSGLTVISCQGADLLILDRPVSDADQLKGGTIAGAGGTPTLLAATLQPPVVSQLTLAYEFSTDPEAPNHCLSVNNSVFTDDSQACRWHNRPFRPFRPVDDQQPAFYLAFDRRLPTGLVSMYIDVSQEAGSGRSAQVSAFTWEYFSEQGWAELSVIDETLGLQQSGMIQFIAPQDAVSSPGPGGDLFRVRARLKREADPPAGAPARAWLNAVWASQRSAHALELAGTSDGNPRQAFFLIYRPVLEGEKIEVQEWSGTGEVWKAVVEDVPVEDLRFEYAPATGAVRAVWVTWHARQHLYQSTAKERHYTIERANGLVRFGDGTYGRIPPAGCPITVSYASGGGVAGNLPAGAITELHTAVPYLMGATNPVPATGGTDIEMKACAVKRGPQQLRHRGRAISPADYEWLAREASPDVANARCLPNFGPDNQVQRGWVSLVVVPRSLDARPQLTPELKRRVLAYLRSRAPAGTARQIRVLEPSYYPISVRTDIVPQHADEAVQLEASLRKRLNAYFHPVNGGDDNLGWNFGQPVYLSMVASIIKETPGVDFIRDISLSSNEELLGEIAMVPPTMLVATGSHELKLTVGED